MTTMSAERETAMTATDAGTMRAVVFHGVNDVRLEEVPRPQAGPGEAVIRVTMDLRHRRDPRLPTVTTQAFRDSGGTWSPQTIRLRNR
ncbi:MAG TPA: hypothetical protein VE974_24670 [Thermoanaerobaculia bacterium]|nr:hypothetical protein [Thermoanaerobaculia bacterium]